MKATSQFAPCGFWVDSTEQTTTFRLPCWGRSSAGRAPRSQCGGQEFDPPRLHQHKEIRTFSVTREGSNCSAHHPPAFDDDVIFVSASRNRRSTPSRPRRQHCLRALIELRRDELRRNAPEPMQPVCLPRANFKIASTKVLERTLNQLIGGDDLDVTFGKACKVRLHRWRCKFNHFNAVLLQLQTQGNRVLMERSFGRAVDGRCG